MIDVTGKTVSGPKYAKDALNSFIALASIRMNIGKRRDWVDIPGSYELGQLR
jgi:hypothetical protein